MDTIKSLFAIGVDGKPTFLHNEDSTVVAFYTRAEAEAFIAANPGEPLFVVDLSGSQTFKPN